MPRHDGHGLRRAAGEVIMKKLVCALVVFALFSVAAPALACSPTVDSVNRTLKDKISGASVAFIGKVEEAADDHVVFLIGALGQGASAKGETMRLEHKDYGTCGKYDFKTGEVWLYAGDTPFTATQRVDDADMDAAFDAVVERLVKAEEEAGKQQE